MNKNIEKAFKSLERLESILLSIVIPAYNTPHLKRNLKKIISVLPKVAYEIIVVNDGSRRFPKNLDTLPGVKVVTHLSNKGKGQALRTGAAEAQGSIIFFFDSDLDIPAESIKPYYEIIRGNKDLDILIGSKRHAESKVVYPFTRRLMSYVYQRMIKFLFGLEILDSQVGIKAFRKDVLKSILPFLKEEGFSIDIEILAIASKKGYLIQEAPVKIKQRFSSTISFMAPLKMIFSTLKIWYRLKGGNDNG